MKASGRVADSTALAEKATTMAVLTARELSLLDKAYMKLVPRYGLLCDEYQSEKFKASNARKKSLFLSRKHWQPPYGKKLCLWLHCMSWV